MTLTRSVSGPVPSMSWNGIPATEPDHMSPVAPTSTDVSTVLVARSAVRAASTGAPAIGVRHGTGMPWNGSCSRSGQGGGAQPAGGRANMPPSVSRTVAAIR